MTNSFRLAQYRYLLLHVYISVWLLDSFCNWLVGAGGTTHVKPIMSYSTPVRRWVNSGNQLLRKYHKIYLLLLKAYFVEKKEEKL